VTPEKSTRDSAVAAEPRFPLHCYVRIPIEDENEANAEDSREYRIGRVLSCPDEFGDLTVCTIEERINEKPRLTERRVPMAHLERCLILPTSRCVHEPSRRKGVVLIDNRVPQKPNDLVRYFVQLNDGIALLPESELLVGSSRQDPDPADQLFRRELHHPTWRQSRDRVVKTMSQLHNASYGLAELVSSRVRLLPHQADAITRVLLAPETRFILADEVGLGKTIEAAVILKALRRVKPDLRVLIVAPGALAFQWHAELDDRFWMRFPVLDARDIHEGNGVGTLDKRGLIVDADVLGSDRDLQTEVMEFQWDLVIIDEAHHVRKDPELDAFLCTLTDRATGVLLLSATPIERHTEEFIPLLRLLDPAKYRRITPKQFARLFASQASIRKSVGSLRRQLRPEVFEAPVYAKSLSTIAELLDDSWLQQTAAGLAAMDSGQDAFDLADQAYSYLSENYRIERRIVRNRRAHLESPMPKRALDTQFCYDPEPQETSTFENLLDYLSELDPEDPATSEYRRLLLNAAASSPHALAHLLHLRSNALQANESGKREILPVSIDAAGARARAQIIPLLVRSIPAQPQELSRVRQLELLTQRWADQETAEARAIAERRGRAEDRAGGRLSHVIRAVRHILQDDPNQKLLIFSDWPETLDQLSNYLPMITGSKSGVVQFRAGANAAELQSAADRFQTDPACRVLLSDQLGGEGRNFQIADAIIHVDLPWSPGKVEQRIGRVDRIGRAGVITSHVICARGSVESDLFRLWSQALPLFTEPLSGMEIRLESLQTTVFNALDQDPVHGLAEIFDAMAAEVEELREIIENEQLVDQGTINARLRANFQSLDDQFRDGSKLWGTLQTWSAHAGIAPRYDHETQIVYYQPKSFNEKSLEKAKFVAFPNMEEAVRRSRRRNDLVVRGTFNREIAVKREDLIFFAPGGEPWTDAVLDNAMTSDRGRCCAILRRVESPESWDGFEFLFTVAIDPRPVFRLGCDPTALLLGQGFLLTPTYSVLVDTRGTFIDQSGWVGKAIKAPWNKTTDTHLGGRETTTGKQSMLDIFRSALPDERWETMASKAKTVAWEQVRREFSFLEDEAANAAKEFANRIHGLAATRQWLAADLEDSLDLENERDLADALVAGIRTPTIRLESICYWMIRPPKAST
jgi:ATP-dependent helicase HepA